MAIVRSLEGMFYDVPDDELGKYQVPPDQVKKLMESAGGRPPAGPRQQQQMGQQQMGQQQGQAPQGAPQILVQFITAGAPAAQQQQQQQQQPPQKPAEGQDESVEPQWYWVNWYNWSNWYNWY